MTNHAVIRDNSTPDKALEFGNLFSRLLSQPVLSQKWAILYLLHQLSDSQTRANLHISNLQANNNGLRSNRIIDEAFSKAGLPRLPTTIASPRPTRTYEHPRKRQQHAISNGDSDYQAANLAERPSNKASESELLRDLPFTLQGISSESMVFSSEDSLRMPQSLPAPIISLLHALAEPSLLYRSLSRFLDSSEGGLIGQSLRAAIGLEMRSYLGLVATLEGQIRRALVSLNETPSSRQGLGKAGVTLKRCVIWTREATMGLRLMSVIVEESQSRKGGQLISLIHSFASSHGDPFVGAFAERLLSHVTQPFYDMLRLWIYDGELSDPYLEFFVIEQGDKADAEDRGGATSVWEVKYRLDDSMIPTIITEEFAKKVFLIGKSLNFIRHGCSDSAWVESYSKDASRELRYGDTASLETSIDEAYKTTMARLILLMNTKFKLLEHLGALKKYILLGQGDFVALLMESLSSNLDRPANSQYRHTLTAQLEHAIRNSNAQFDSPDVLRRLDARMLELSHGEIGWDVFTLEYKIDAPVDVIVTAHGSKQYLKVFNFLWRVKRVEFALSSTWRRCMTGARGVLGAVADKVGADWKTARCAVAEMIHFITQLQYYILFEVIEASWSTLQVALARPGATLDDLITAHATYLKSITRKGLLNSSGHLDFPSQLHELLKIMLAYKDAVDGLYSFSVAEYTRRQDKTARIDARTRQGRWGLTEADDAHSNSAVHSRAPRSRDIDSPGIALPSLLLGAADISNNASVLPALRTRLANLATEFRTRVAALLGDLAYQPDTDMRFLGVVMNFNDTYKVVRRSRRAHNGPGAVPKTITKERNEAHEQASAAEMKQHRRQRSGRDAIK